MSERRSIILGIWYRMLLQRKQAYPKGKDLVVDEFKKVLTAYQGSIVYQEEARAKLDETLAR